jgi:DNA-binding GntR family transcriptional regulator
VTGPRTPALDPVGGDRVTLAGRALAGVRAAIVDGRLEAGERYSVATLAAGLGVSRTPVREALLVLERQGLVRFERNKGVRILETSTHDLEEIFTLRLLLEVPAARRACGRLTAADLDTLDRELDAMADAAAAGRETPFMAHDQRFHAVLLEAAGNHRIVALIDQLRDHVRFRGASTVGRGRDLAAILAEHVVIRDALRRRDPEAAAAAMRAHLLATGELLVGSDAGAGEGEAARELDWAAG